MRTTAFSRAVRLEIFQEGGEFYRLVWLYERDDGTLSCRWVFPELAKSPKRADIARKVGVSIIDQAISIKKPKTVLPPGNYLVTSDAEWYALTTWDRGVVKRTVVYGTLLNPPNAWRPALQASGYEIYLQSIKRLKDDLENLSR